MSDEIRDDPEDPADPDDVGPAPPEVAGDTEDADDAGVAGDAGDPEADLARERDELLGTLQRVQADFENFRKRVMRDQAATVERATETLVEALLPVLDSFELAVLTVPSGQLDETSEKLRKGVELVYAELLGVLEKTGLERIEALGSPFDPNLHEAVMRDPGDGDGDDVVTEVMRTGYRYKGRVLRPAMVRVASTAG